MADADFGYVGGAPGKIDLCALVMTPAPFHLFMFIVARSRTAASQSGRQLVHISA